MEMRFFDHMENRQVYVPACDCDTSLLNGWFSPSPCGSQLLCAPSYKASQEGLITCAWFFGPQGVVEISPLYYREHHTVITLRSYSTLACVPFSQGQAIPAVPINCSRSGRDLAPLLSRAS